VDFSEREQGRPPVDEYILTDLSGEFGTSFLAGSLTVGVLNELLQLRFEGRQTWSVRMQITSFKEMYVAELQELVSLEGQLADALQRAAEAASHPSLKDLFKRHRLETLQQGDRVRSVLQNHGADAQTHTDQSMQALIAETEKMAGILQGDDLRDAGLIASAQKLEHYEIAAYGSAAALAGQLNLRDDQKQLHAILEEERRADKLLSELAKSEINQDAAA
jgi:ferritin-like metal-binding protein YciE